MIKHDKQCIVHSNILGFSTSKLICSAPSLALAPNFLELDLEASHVKHFKVEQTVVVFREKFEDQNAVIPYSLYIFDTVYTCLFFGAKYCAFLNAKCANEINEDNLLKIQPASRSLASRIEVIIPSSLPPEEQHIRQLSATSSDFVSVRFWLNFMRLQNRYSRYSRYSYSNGSALTSQGQCQVKAAQQGLRQTRELNRGEMGRNGTKWDATGRHTKCDERYDS